jgi:hypothetical protein
MRSCVLLAVAVALAACGGSAGGEGEGSDTEEGSESAPDFDDDQPPKIRDQSGAEFGWSCTEGGHCEVQWVQTLRPPLPECGAGTIPTYGHLWFRFIEVTAACALDEDGAWQTRAGWGRLLVCEEDDDCPQLPDSFDRFECSAGYCQRTSMSSGPPRKEDLELLCTGQQPRFADIDPTPDLAAAIDRACPNSTQDPDAPCLSIPPGCDDPG